MRVPLALMILTLVWMLIGAVAVRASAKQPTMADIVFRDPAPAVLNADESAATDITELVRLDNLWKADEESTPLWVRFVRGVLRSREMEKVNGTKYIRWERCGERVPEDQYYTLATEWSLTIVSALQRVERETGVALNPWGVFATTANEGGFNECSLNFAARKWAAKTLEEVEHFQLSYDRDTIWTIIKHPKYRRGKIDIKNEKTGEVRTVKLRNKFDGGPFQIRLSVKTIKRKNFDQLMSIHPGVYLGVREMARRAKNYKRLRHSPEIHPRPWMLWPGALASLQRKYRYDSKITSVARWLGARRDEI